MDQSRLTYLFNSYYNKTASPQERAEFLDIIAGSENDEYLKSLLTEKWQNHKEEKESLNGTQAEEMLSAILHFPANASDTQENITIPTRRIHKLIPFAAAAAVLLVLGISLYFQLKPGSFVQRTAQSLNRKTEAKIVQGGKKALLTLADGSKITLDTAHQGMLIRQGSTKISRQSSATLVYQNENTETKELAYNTLSTPNGGQYELILPDQTRVWLNSASSIRFPTQFSGKERNVSISGEVYFEVSKNAKMPFKISVNQMEVQVLGTHFNIMAYKDENSVNTSLLEGSVKVISGETTKILVPGQESRVHKNGSMTVVAADMEGVMAWKNGWFNFNQCDLQKIMRQISRWYDVDVVYQGKIPNGRFSGIISQKNGITKILDILQAGGVNFKTEGKKIIVLP